jgi:heptosyltransferase II
LNDPNRILVRATNWVGDAVMSLPALAAVRRRFPAAYIAVLARPWVADLYGGEPFANEILPYHPGPGWAGWSARRTAAHRLKEEHFDCALLFQNAFDAALVTWMGRIPRRIGYARDGRSLLLTDLVPPPVRGTLPPHESFYYLELLRRVGWLEQLPAEPLIRLEGATAAKQAGRQRFEAEGIEGALLGMSPGAAYGGAKMWLPERFAEAAVLVAEKIQATIALFGSGAERDLCERIRAALISRGVAARNYAGATSLREFIERVAACAAYLTNDSGAMHIASALGVPTVAVFGATNHITTGPTGPGARVIRHDVECSPCLLRECPLDHRCMKAVGSAEVAIAALELLQRNTSGHTQ